VFLGSTLAAEVRHDPERYKTLVPLNSKGFGTDNADTRKNKLNEMPECMIT
jgi:hypothetical protein